MQIAATFGRITIHRLQILGRSGIFLFMSLTQAFVPPYRFHRIIKEIDFIGSKSFLIVFVTALFTGMVLGIQGYYSLSQFGAEAALGVMGENTEITEEVDLNPMGIEFLEREMEYS